MEAEKWGVIKRIHKRDAFYREKEKWLGRSGKFQGAPCADNELGKKGWKCGDFTPDESPYEGQRIFFFAVKVVTPRGRR